MRDILFRAKSGQTWYYGGVHCEKFYRGPIGYSDYKYRWHIVTDEGDEYQVRPDTICQYTGLNDKNGTKIFEGDIVKITRRFRNGMFSEDSYICKYNDKLTSFEFKYITPKDLQELNRYAIVEDSVSMGVLGNKCVLEVAGNQYDNNNSAQDK